MQCLSRESILGCRDMPAPERVEVPGWGGAVHVRPLTADERDRFERFMMQAFKAAGVKPGDKDAPLVYPAGIRAQLIVLTCCDEDGRPLFTDADVEALGRKAATAVQPIFDAAMRLCGMTERDVEDLRKNSATIPDAASASA